MNIKRLLRTVRATCASPARAMLGENPVWDPVARCLYWLDVPQGRLHCHNPELGTDAYWNLGAEIAALALRSRGGLVFARGAMILALDPATEETTPIAEIADLHPGARLNDCGCDSAGNLWIGSMDRLGRQPIGSIYRVSAAGKVTTVDTGYVISNGAAFRSPLEFFVADSARREIHLLRVDGQGALADKRCVIRFAERDGSPDGMVIDSEGFLWVAHYGGWCVSRWSPEFRRASTFPLPVRDVTSLAFGGVGLNTLYVTTSRRDLDETALARHPVAGAVFRLDVRARGSGQFAFGG